MLTPAELGYRWPAEWEPHAATWVAWPHNRETWPGRYDGVPAQFAQLIRAIAQSEPVHVLAGGGEVMDEARRWLSGIPDVTLWDIPTNDAWCRDHGPTFLKGPTDRPPLLLDWQYNAWGGKYPPYDDDNAVPGRIAGRLGYERRPAPLVLEGGAIENSGEGILLTTASCLLNPNRNPGRSREEVEQILRDYLGVQCIVWLPRGELMGDDTDGHIDQLARFVAPRTVLAAVETDSDGENYEPLRANLDYLRGWRDPRGESFEVIELPIPRCTVAGQRLPASYCNFYIANRTVLVPLFDAPQDETALEILQRVFPQREVQGLSATRLVWGLGAFHCLTQQEPM